MQNNCESDFNQCISLDNSFDADFYYTVNGFIIHNPSEIPPNAIVQKHLRLRGGKGGFGSMLRAMGSKMVKTTNKGMCRDLNGRRMRDVNNEKRLKEWLEKADEREREKFEKYMEKRMKRRKLLEQGPSTSVPFEENIAEEQRKQISRCLEDAISYAFEKQSNEKDMIKKVVKPKKINMNIDSDLESSSSSSRPSSPELSDCENQCNDATEFTDHSISESIENSGPESTDHLVTESTDNLVKESIDNAVTDSVDNWVTESTDHPFENISPQSYKESLDTDKTSDSLEQPAAKRARIDNSECSSSESVSISQSINYVKENKVYDPIDLEQVDSIQQLQAFGADWIKYDLNRRGLKCGGTLIERATRLFSVRGLKVYPNNLLARAVREKRK